MPAISVSRASRRWGGSPRLRFGTGSRVPIHGSRHRSGQRKHQHATDEPSVNRRKHFTEIGDAGMAATLARRGSRGNSERIFDQDAFDGVAKLEILRQNLCGMARYGRGDDKGIPEGELMAL